LQKGKVLITGGTSGLGYELVKWFLREGYEVYATGRDQTRITNLNERVKFVKIDFSILADVKNCIQALLDNDTGFDVVINNAGVLSPPKFTLTENSMEYSFQVNYLAHLLINEMIIKNVRFNNPIKIISVTSPTYRYVKPGYKQVDKTGYSPFKVYAESKFYLLLIGEYLRKKYPEKDLIFIGYDPGTFSSEIFRMQNKWFQILYNVAAPFMRSPNKVAQNLGEILKKTELINGAVYRGKKSFRIIDQIEKEAIDVFMTKCYSQIEPYIR
jgi:NAD(P)-dependent dehydrogenase (short-subunit alcohol dehydrogenase family)